MSAEKDRGATPAEIESWLRERIAESIHLPVDAVQAEASFETFGVDSARAISLVTDLEAWLSLPDELPLELLFEAESIREASEGIAGAVAEMTGAGSQFPQFS